MKKLLTITTALALLGAVPYSVPASAESEQKSFMYHFYKRCPDSSKVDFVNGL